MDISQEWKRRFVSKYKVDAQSECWIWIGAKLPKGYGIIKIPGTRRQEYAHRLSWLIHVGEIPDGSNVLHKCDVPSCVNPSHLFLGTKSDNSQDMKSKGRHLCGEKNSESVLTEVQVREIKRLLEMNFSQSRIGAMFGVSQISISRISRGLRWAHVK